MPPSEVTDPRYRPAIGSVGGEGAVLFNAAQFLSASQRQQAHQNLGLGNAVTLNSSAIGAEATESQLVRGSDPRLIAVANKANLQGGRLAIAELPDQATMHVVTTANQSTRLMMNATAVRGRLVRQLDNGVIYSLRANGSPNIGADWDVVVLPNTVTSLTGTQPFVINFLQSSTPADARNTIGIANVSDVSGTLNAQVAGNLRIGGANFFGIDVNLPQAFTVQAPYVSTPGVRYLALTNSADGSISAANITGLSALLSNKADLVGGKLPLSQLPEVVGSLTASIPVANFAARLALSPEQAVGKIVVQSDDGSSWMLVQGGVPSNASNWLQVGDNDITAEQISNATPVGINLLKAASPEDAVDQLGAQPAGDYIVEGDERLTDPRAPLPHQHATSDLPLLKQDIEAMNLSKLPNVQITGMNQLLFRAFFSDVTEIDAMTISSSGANPTALLININGSVTLNGSSVITDGDSRLADAREWNAITIPQAEAEAGTSTTRRAFTAQRVWQAIAAWWNTFSVAFRNFVANPTSDNFALLLTDESGTGGGFVRSNGCTLNSPIINNLSANSLSQQTMDLILTNEIVPSPPVAFFDDFLGDRASDLNWEVSSNGGSDTNGPSGATNVFGLLQIFAPVNGFRQRILRAGPTIVNGIIIEACFAVPNLTDCGVSLGIQRPASGFDVGVVANTAVNNGQWTFQNGLGANTLITSIAPTAGDFITGKKYRVRIEFVSTTQVNIQILEADGGLTNWTQVFSGPVTTPSQDRGGGVSSHGTPRIGCSAGASGTRSVIVDWFRYRNSLNVR